MRQILGEQLRLVHIDCPLEVCIARDVKGLYAKAAARQMTGMTGTQDDFEAPPESCLSVRTDLLEVQDAVDLIHRSEAL